VKRKPIAIKKKDGARVLLTEILPYELPVFFSNHRLYELVSNPPDNTPSLLKGLLGLSAAPKFTIPFNFKIERGDGRKRTLSIMHPASQLKFIDFYATWDHYIINQCSKSEYSLRRPVQVGSVYFESILAEEGPAPGDEAGDLAPGSSKEQRTHASSYFYYASYNQIWKFYDSTEFRRLEQNYRRLLRLDVSKCFQSIYTHSISWAVRDRAFAKKYKDAESFDKSFDSLMQGSNWNETNGILVGPEVSRLFAEVILQQVDDDIAIRLMKAGLGQSQLRIKRYVDDYLVFFNSEEASSVARSAIEGALEKYKLSINDAKTEILESPLISDLSIARDAVRGLLRERISSQFKLGNPKLEETQEPVRPPNERSADHLIRALKAAIKTNKATYSTISPYALGLISRVLSRANKSLAKDAIAIQNPHHIYQKLSYVLEMAFFLYRMDVRVNTTYRVASILLTIAEMADKFGSTGKILRQEIVDHGVSVLKQARRASVGECETSSLLACLFYIGGATAVAESDVIDALRLSEVSEAGYFKVVTALFCAQEKPGYDMLRNAACDAAERIFEHRKVDIHLDAEATLLFLDVVSCPFARDSTKELALGIFTKSLGYKAMAVGEMNFFKKFAARHLSFCDWRSTNELPALLKRKELKPAYD